MKKREEVSIIVPMYNVEQYVEKCLDSLINQTYKEIKIYAVSDGSPDNSFEIAKKIAKKDNRIEVIKKENGGYGSVLEYVINNIETKYFLICDPDDWLADNAIELLVSAAENNESDITIANYNLFCNGIVYNNIKTYNANYFIESKKLYTDLTNFTFTSVSPHAKLYLTSKAKNINFPKKVSYTDKLLYYVYLSRSCRALYLDEQLAFYYEDRPNNSMSQIKKYTKKACEQEIIVFHSIFEQLNYESPIINALLYNLFSSYIYSLKNIKNIDDRKERIICKKNISKELRLFSIYRKKMYIYIKGNKIKKLLKRIRLFLVTFKFNKLIIKILY